MAITVMATSATKTEMTIATAILGSDTNNDELEPKPEPDPVVARVMNDAGPYEASIKSEGRASPMEGGMADVHVDAGEGHNHCDDGESDGTRKDRHGDYGDCDGHDGCYDDDYCDDGHLNRGH